jgi:hypothetical protein
VRHRVLLLAFCGLLLAACGGGSGVQPRCPKVAVLKELAKLTDFREGAGRDVTDRRFAMAFVGLDSSCKYDKTGVTIDITLQIEATQGLAAAESKATAQYFAAVFGPDGQILQKEPFDAQAEFTQKQGGRILLTENLRQRIPLKDGSEGAGYSLVFGFQLNQDQLDYVHRTEGQ